MIRVKNIIIGGGIAGLCTAFHLKQMGENVTVVEAATVGHKASSKAAGMITPASEIHLGENILMNCFAESCSYYDEFIKKLTAGKPELVDFHRNGSLLTAIDQDGKQELTRLAAFQKSMGLELQELSASQARELEPFLTHKTVLALYAPHEAHIDNIKLIHVLKKYLLENGVEILENKNVSHVNFAGDQIKSVMIGDKEGVEIFGDRFILTTGLESLKDLDKIHPIPLRGVKGQTVTIQTTPGTIKRPIRIYHRYPIYLVPRADGRIVIGATSEEKSDETLVAGNIMDLIYAAWQALPLVYESRVLETNVGLRPATPDNKPVFGLSKLKNLFLFTGLYRHGILLSPFLAKELVSLLLEKNTNDRWQEFSIERFS